MTMRFQVPQFIEQETKILGPFTLKQSLFVAGGLASLFLWYTLTSGFVFIVLAMLSAAFFGSLAFLKINGLPFLNYLAYLLSYLLTPKQYFFRQQKKDVVLPGSQS